MWFIGYCQILHRQWAETKHQVYKLIFILHYQHLVIVTEQNPYLEIISTVVAQVKAYFSSGELDGGVCAAPIVN